MAVSGGLYLLDIKGSMEKGETIVLEGVTIDDTGDKSAQVKKLLEQANLSNDFEYLKDRGAVMQTRPTSRDHYEIKTTGNRVEITPVSPDLVAAMMELHKGHGPGLFRLLEQIMALGLILTLLTGLIVGLQSPLLKTRTVGFTAAGIFVFVIFAAIM
jgi:hypothetical protein